VWAGIGVSGGFARSHPLHRRYDRSYHRRYDTGIQRFHGLGEGGYCHERGVKRFHGLGDGVCYQDPVYYVTPDGLGAYYGYPFPTEAWPPRYSSPRAARPDPPAATRAPRPAEPTSPMTDEARADRAWVAIGSGAPRTALREFAILALRRPDDAAPRIGYALAASMLLRHDDATWSLRLALERSAAVMRDFPIDESVASIVRILADYYANDHDPGPDGVGDTLLLRATLHTLLDEDSEARALLDTLEPADDDDATAALRALLHRDR
jgi:hypothetical protein